MSPTSTSPKIIVSTFLSPELSCGKKTREKNETELSWKGESTDSNCARMSYAASELSCSERNNSMNGELFAMQKNETSLFCKTDFQLTHKELLDYRYKYSEEDWNKIFNI